MNGTGRLQTRSPGRYQDSCPVAQTGEAGPTLSPGKEHSGGYFPDDLFQEEPEMALFESAKGDVPKSSSQEVSERFLQFGETEMETGLQCFFRDDPLAVKNQ